MEWEEREREEKRKRNKIGERESIHTSISIVMSIGEEDKRKPKHVEE